MRPTLLLLAATCLGVAALSAQAAEPGLVGGNVGPRPNDTSEVRHSSLSGQPVGAALRALDWWPETNVQVRKLETYEKSEEALRAGLPSNRDSLDWHVLGPIPVKSRSDYYRSYPPEEGVDLTGTVVIGETQFSWQRPYPEGKTGSGLNLRSLLKAEKGGVAYLYRELVAEEASDTGFFVGFYTGCRIWLNGEEVFFSDSSAYNEPDRIELPVQLHAGLNRILVKTFSRSSSWNFYFHTGRVHPRKARIKGRWLLADLFPEEPEQQLAARLAVVRDLLGLKDQASLQAAREILDELAGTGPVTGELIKTAQRVAQTAVDRGKHAEAERTWSLVLELLARAPEDLRAGVEPVALAGLAAARGRLGDMRGAQRVYGRLVSEYQSAEVAAEALWTLAEFYRREGRTWLARPLYERLLSDLPDGKRVKGARTHLDWCKQFAGDRPGRKGSFSATRHLAQAVRLEQAGDAPSALRLYLEALERWPDELVRVPSEGATGFAEVRLLGVARIVREKAHALWSALPPEVQAEVGAAADRALAEATSLGGPEALPGLLRLHPLAPSTAEVLSGWAGVLMERGELARAAAALSRLLGDYRLPPAREAQAAARLAFCARLLDDDRLRVEARRHLSQLPPGTTITWAGQDASPADVLAWLSAEEGPAQPSVPRLNGLPDRPVTVRLLPDIPGQQLLNPRWPTPRTPVPWRPVLADGVLYTYDQQAARALTLDGKLLWRSRPYPRPVRAVKGRNFKGLAAYLTVVDDRRLYAVQLAADRSFLATRTALFAYDRATGQVLWSTENEPALSHYDVASPPLVAFDRLYVVAHSRQVLSDQLLVTLDPETGRVLSTALLASLNGNVKVFREPRYTYEYDAVSLVPPPVADTRHLYVATQTGAVVALCALSGEVDWVLEYPRTSLVSTDDTFIINYICRGLSPPVVTGDLLLVVPRDSGDLLAIDRASGELRWRRDDYEFSELWGVAAAGQDRVVVAGDVPGGVLACSAETGEVRWYWRPPAGEKSGRGLVADGRVLVPTGEALYELSLSHGRVLTVKPLGVPCREVTALAWAAGGLTAAWEGGLLLWPAQLTAPSPGLDETFVEMPTRFRHRRKSERSETPLVEQVSSRTGEPAVSWSPVQPTWAPVSPVAGAGTQVAVFPAEDGEDVVSWDGRWLRLHCLARGSTERAEVRPVLRWRRALGSAVRLVRANARLVVVAAGPQLVALERDTGREVWRWSIPVRTGGYWSFDNSSRTFTEVRLADGLVVAGLYRSVWALDAQTGVERWHFSCEYDLRALSVDREYVYAVTSDYRRYLRLYALDHRDGRPRADAEFRDLDARNLHRIIDGPRLWTYEPNRRRITAYDLTRASQTWQESYPELERSGYLGHDDRYLFFILQPPRGQPPRLLAVEKAAGAQAFLVHSPEFQTALKLETNATALAPSLAPRPFLVVPGEEMGLEPGAVMLFQEGTDLVAWPAYEPFEAGKELARRWPIFEEKELLTSVVRRGRYLFLATVRPYPEEREEGKEVPSALVQPTLRVVELPQVRVVETGPLPSAEVRVSWQWLLPLKQGMLHLGPAGLSLLAPVSGEEAVEELRALRRSPGLGRGEQALLELLIAGLDPVEVVAQPCAGEFQVEVDGDLSEWSAVGPTRFPSEGAGSRRLFPETAGRSAPDVVPLAATLRLAYDKDWFYLAVEVVDDVHHPPREAGAEWRSDALLLRIVPTAHTLGLRKSLSLTIAGPTGRRRLEAPMGRTRATVRVGIGRERAATTYELAVARSSLMATDLWPPPRGEFRLLLSVTDRDDSGLREMITFPPGPHTGRQLDSLATVTFTSELRPNIGNLLLKEWIAHIDTKEMTEAASATYSRLRRAPNADLSNIPPDLWADPIRELHPVRVYMHQYNTVIVLKESDGSEEGVYVWHSISSWIPRSGVDGFVFTRIDGEGPVDGRHSDSIYMFKRTKSR